MHSVQANTIGDLITFVFYSIWGSICFPFVAFFASLSAFFFGDYVKATYDGMDFCQGVFFPPQ